MTRLGASENDLSTSHSAHSGGVRGLGAPGTCPYIPVLLSGGSRVIKKNGREILVKGKPEDWAVSLNGQVLGHPHPTMGDRASADLYIRLLNEERALAIEPGCKPNQSFSGARGGPLAHDLGAAQGGMASQMPH